MISFENIKKQVLHPRRFVKENNTSIMVFIAFVAWPILGAFFFTSYPKIDSITSQSDAAVCSDTQLSFILQSRKNNTNQSDDNPTTLLIQNIKDAARGAGVAELKNLQVVVKGKDKGVVDVSYDGTYEKFVRMVNQLEENGHQISEMSLEFLKEEGNIDLLAIRFSLEHTNFPNFHRDLNGFKNIPNELSDFIGKNAQGQQDANGDSSLYSKDNCNFDVKEIKSAVGSFPSGSVPAEFKKIFDELATVVKYNIDQRNIVDQIASISEKTPQQDIILSFRNPFHEYIRYFEKNYLKVPDYYKLDRIDIVDNSKQADINGIRYVVGDRFPRNAHHKDGTAFSNLDTLVVREIDPGGFVLFRQDNVYPSYLLLPKLKKL
ncbi:MAG: hypothetical protein HQL07_00170 [Nitrospirae bacterium]|nr:hypothetical protein [Magnetococcales bacterium]HAT49648.1 hypothetical protein [Alphaproteobacteria bacterium]